MNKLRKLQKPAKWIGAAILTAAILMSLFVLMTPSFGLRTDSIRSGSMEPALGAGDIVISKRIDPYHDIQVGDIIVFRPAEGAVRVSHRVIDITYIGEQPVFTTKGDANEDPDPYPVYPSYVTSKVAFHVPYLGYFSDFVKTTPGLIVTLVLPGLVVIAFEIRNILKELSRMEGNRKGDPVAGGEHCKKD